MMDLTEIIALLPLALAGFAISLAVFAVCKDKIGIKSTAEYLIVGFAVPLVGHLCGRAWAWFEGFLVGASYNMRFHGMVFLAPIVYLILCHIRKYDLGHFFDAIGLSTAPTLVASRINCLYAGCDWGRVIPGMSWRWPTREVEILFCTGFTLYLFRLHEKGESKGQLFPLLMIIYGIFRFFWEGFYEVDKLLLGVHPAHIWSIITLIVGCSIYFEMQAQKDEKTKAKHRRS